jgi:cytochrome b561
VDQLSNPGLAPDGPLNTDYWSIHVVFGFALVAVIAWRIIWRNSGGDRLPAADTGVLHVVAQATHYALYLLLLAAVRGYNLFDLVSLPQIGDRAMRNGFAANLLLGLAGLHATAALFHHYIMRDSVLARMVPARDAYTIAAA